MTTAQTYDAKAYNRGITALAFVTTGKRPPRPATHVRWGVVALWAVLAVCIVLVAWGPGGIRVIATIVGLFDLLALALFVGDAPALVVRPERDCGAR